MHLDNMLPKNADVPARRAAIEKELDRFKAAGLRVAMPYMKDTGGAAAYESKMVPAKYKDWDALADIMTAAHARGLQVWPVICVVPSGGEGSPSAILKDHPEWALRTKDGQPGGYVSPSNPAARKWMIAMVGELAERYQPEGVLLDYLRFPGANFQFDPESAARFEKEYPGDKTASAAERAKHVQEFRVKNLTELARGISEELRRVRPGIRIGLYTWGPQVVEGHYVAQDWRTWLAKGYIDHVDVSGYLYEKNGGPDYMKKFADRMKLAVEYRKQAGNKGELSLTLGVVTSHGRVKSAAEIGEYIRVARKAGIDGVSFFTWTTLQPYLDEVLQAGYLKP
jgi:uncharacterized lipoprotein YddW (UPF0748 family)